MRMRALSVGGFFLLLLTLVAMPAQRVAADDPAPTCYDQRTDQIFTATKWLTTPGPLVGTNKRDVLVGSTGIDTIKGLGGNDIICSSPSDGDETFGDAIDAGTGDDYVRGMGIVDGGTGNDYIVLHWIESQAFGGPGHDQILMNGGLGDGGSGNDLVVGFGAHTLLGGSGTDKVGNMDGAPLMDCGSGTDSYYAGDASPVRRCEKPVSSCQFPFFNGGINAVKSSEVSAAC
jgi:hypothetical protein